MSIESIIVGAIAASMTSDRLRSIVLAASDALRIYLTLSQGRDENEISLQSPSNRLSIGKTKVDGKEKAIVVLEEASGAAFDEAERLKTNNPNDVEIVVIGRAFASQPQRKRTKSPGALVNTLRPGRSVSHINGFAGTLGLIANFRPPRKRKQVLGLLSASHVLRYRDDTRVNDQILSPGPPDEDRDLANVVAELKRGSILSHYLSEDDENKIINNTDIAAAQITRLSEGTESNEVPVSEDGVNTVVLSDVADDEQTFALVNEQDVYSVGRSSGLTVGRIFAAKVQAHPIRLPNRRSYLYGDLLFIRSRDKRKNFSTDGDSGAPVYTSDGVLVGFIVGGAGNVSLAHPARSCLEAVDANLF